MITESIAPKYFICLLTGSDNLLTHGLLTGSDKVMSFICNSLSTKRGQNKVLGWVFTL